MIVKPRLKIPKDEAEARQMVNVIVAMDLSAGGGVPWPERRLLIVIRHVIAEQWPHLVDEPGGETRG
jgi:hypothetical protein